MYATHTGRSPNAFNFQLKVPKNFEYFTNIAGEAQSIMSLGNSRKRGYFLFSWNRFEMKVIKVKIKIFENKILKLRIIRREMRGSNGHIFHIQV